MSPQARQYLAILERDGRAFHQAAALAEVGVRARTLQGWRANYPEFREAEKALAERARATLGDWLDAFARTLSRGAACRETGLPWREVKARLGEDAEAQARYAEVEEERVLVLDDALFAKGREGHVTAARAFLNARGNRYADRTFNLHVHTTAEDARAAREAHYGRYLGAGDSPPPGPGGGVSGRTPQGSPGRESRARGGEAGWQPALPEGEG